MFTRRQSLQTVSLVFTVVSSSPVSESSSTEVFTSVFTTLSNQLLSVSRRLLYSALLETYLGDNGSFAASFALGWVVTVVSGLASYPIDTVRRRMMMTSVTGKIYMKPKIWYKPLFRCPLQIIPWLWFANLEVWRFHVNDEGSRCQCPSWYCRCSCHIWRRWSQSSLYQNEKQLNLLSCFIPVRQYSIIFKPEN